MIRLKTFSIIIPILNGVKLIGVCLQSLEPQLQPGDEIIVVDNGSTDGTPELIARDFPRARVLRMGRNLGYGGGANRGIETARGDALVILNHDMTFLDGCFAALRKRLDEIGPCVLGCKLLYPDGRTIQHAGGTIAYPRAEPNHAGYRQIDDGRWDAVTEPGYVTGALFVIDRAVINSIGLFDDAFFPLYYEEVDYCYRARAAGFRVIYDPAAVAIHHETQTYDPRSNAYYQAMLRGRVRFVLKNYSADQLLNDFFPAEREYLRVLPDEYTRAVCAPAYMSVLSNLPRRAARNSREAIIKQLSALHIEALRLPKIDEVAMTEPIQLPALHEHDFQSNVRVIGPLIRSVRRALYNLTARWGVLAVIQQQDHINAIIAQHLNEYEQRLRRYETEYHARLLEFDARLIEQDRDVTALTRSLAELEIATKAQGH